MRQKDDNDYTFPAIWNIFLAFENVSRDKDEKLDAFIRRWQETLGRAQTAGCGYSDTLLACKLLQQANLDDLVVQSVVNSIVCGKTEILVTLLCTLEDYSGRKFDREQVLSAGRSQPIGGFQEEYFRVPKLETFTEEDLLLKIELKDDSYEAQSLGQLDSFHSLEKSRELTGNQYADASGISTLNENEDDSSATTKEPFDGEEDDSSQIPESNVAADSNRFLDDPDEDRRIRRRERRFECPECGHFLPTKANLVIHMRTHTGEKPFKCSLCENSYSSQFSLNHHQIKKHVQMPAIVDEGQIRPFKCIECGRAYKHKKELDKHKMAVHRKETPFKCTICSYSVVEKYRLVKHMMVHTNNGVHKCPYCVTSYKLKNNLIQHIKKEHENEEMGSQGAQGPLKCTFCETVLGDRDGMILHLKEAHGETFDGSQALLLPKEEIMQRSKEQTDDSVANGEGLDQGSKEEVMDEMGADVKQEAVANYQGNYQPVPELNLAKLVADLQDGTYENQEANEQGSEDKAGQSFTETGEDENADETTRKRYKRDKALLYCSACPLSFKQSCALRRHYMREHTNARLLKCPLCDFGGVDENELSSHIRNHSGERPYPCEFCDKSFAEKRSLVAHIQTYHEGNEDSIANIPRLKCPHCNFTTEIKNTLNAHIFRHTGEKPYLCSECPKGFMDKGKLNLHFRRQHTTERPFKCTTCGFGALSKKELIIHIRSHTGEKPFKCSLCEKPFKTKKLMNGHIRTVHVRKQKKDDLNNMKNEPQDLQHENSHDYGSLDDLEPKPKKEGQQTQCELCGKSFHKKYMRKHHAKCLRKAQGLEPEKLQCEHCGKDYSDRISLKMHYRICPNLGEEEKKAKGYKLTPRTKKKFTCKICNKTFLGKFVFRNHMTLHSGERNFKCDVCEKTFSCAFYLETHMYRHAKEKWRQCDKCDKSFAATNELKRHIMRVHTDERPFQCRHCSYKTVAKYYLERHMRSHTGETPYKCNLCGKMYKDRKSVKRHLNAHHGQCDEENIGKVVTYEVKNDETMIVRVE